jgi:hypothetical protein
VIHNQIYNLKYDQLYFKKIMDLDFYEFEYKVRSKTRFSLKMNLFPSQEQTFLSSMMQFNLTHRFLKYILRSYICHKNMVILTYFKFASGVKLDINLNYTLG